MADQNSFTLSASAWVPADQWAAATDALRRRYLTRVGELAIVRKKKELQTGIGVDGAPLAKVKPRSRPDGATGKPLDPHYGASRSVKWLRSSPGLSGGTVTIWWSHGWGRILGYHARGEVIGAYIRDVIGLTKTDTRDLQVAARAFWKAIVGQAKAGTPKVPKAKAKAKVKAEVPVPVKAPVKAAPVPAPVPVPVPTVKVYGNVGPDLVAEVRAAAAAFPAKARAALLAHGVELAVADSLTTVAPELAALAPRGWPAGTTWADVEGMYRRDRRQAVAVGGPQSRGPDGKPVPAWRALGAFRHEAGHALDDALGRASAAPGFAAAYAGDLAAMNGYWRKNTGYYRQAGAAGPEEVFAEAFAQVAGGGPDPRRLADAFPASVKYLEDLLK